MIFPQTMMLQGLPLYDVREEAYSHRQMNEESDTPVLCLRKSNLVFHIVSSNPFLQAVGCQISLHDISGQLVQLNFTHRSKRFSIIAMRIVSAVDFPIIAFGITSPICPEKPLSPSGKLVRHLRHRDTERTVA